MTDKIPGGLADNKTPADFNKAQLAKGIEVELEHVNDRALAQEIAMDHLVEDPEYYTKLERMEGKKQASVLPSGVLTEKLAKWVGTHTQHGNIKGKKRNEIYEAVLQDTGSKETAARVANSYKRKGSGRSKQSADWVEIKKLVSGVDPATVAPAGPPKMKRART